MTVKKPTIWKRLRLGLFGEAYYPKLLVIWILFIMCSIFISSFNDYIDYDFEDDHGFEVNVWSWIIFGVFSSILYCLFKIHTKGDISTVIIILAFLFNGVIWDLGLADILMWIFIIRLFAELFFALLDNSGEPLPREETY